MKVVYIAGKYRGPNPWAVVQNIRAAEEVAAKVIRAGHMPLTPHKNTAHMEGLADDAFFLAGTMELLRRCDAVLLVPGWSRSVGARLELVEANRIGLPVFGRHACIDDEVNLRNGLNELREWAELGTRPMHERLCREHPDEYTMNPPRIFRDETDSEYRARLMADPAASPYRRIVEDERFVDVPRAT